MTGTTATRLSAVVLAALLAFPSAASSEHLRKHRKPRSAAAVVISQPLAPEAAALKAAQQYWPNRPLCDEGGYRIRPCDMGNSRR